MKTFIATIVVCARMAVLPAGGQGLLILAGPAGYESPTEFTQDFNSYPPGDQLAEHPGWTVVPAGGAFKTGSAGVYSDVLNAYSAAGYAPAGFTIAPNHEVEGMIYDIGGGGESYQGITCAFQANGDCYLLMYGASTVFFYWGAGGVASDGLFVNIGPIITNGLKLRLTVTGTGATRVCTASYDRNEGAGWVTPAGWGNRDFGAGRRLDGGKGGIVGYSNTKTVRIDSLTIRNLPPSEVIQNFDSYTAGVSLATLPGWTIFNGGYTVATSAVWVSPTLQWVTARYDPPGFTVSANHEAEITLSTLGGGGTHNAVAAAVQADGAGYIVNTDGGNVIYFGRILPGGGGYVDQVSVDTSAVTTGTKLRVSVTGTGAARRVTGSYSLASGGGWVTPAGWANKDFGAGNRYDGGTCGLFGYAAAHTHEVMDLTIRNLPPPGPPGPPTVATDDFNSYGDGTALGTHPGWTAMSGAFSVNAGSVSSSTGGGNWMRWAPAGFATDAEHEAECTLLAQATPSPYQGVMAASINTWDGYYTAMDSTGQLVIGVTDGGSGVQHKVLVVPTGSIPAGTKLRMAVTGTGTGRRITGSYNIGAGWVTPATFVNFDPAPHYFQGGSAGLIGSSNSGLIRIDSVSVANMAPQFTQNFDSYAPGVGVATLRDWTQRYGSFITVAGGTVTSNTASGQCFANYDPLGFVPAAAHQVEMTYAGAADGGGSVFQGPTVAMQPDGSGYIVQFDNNGIIYYGASPVGGGIVNYLSVDTGAGIPAGSKIRLSATGAGAARVTTCEYNLGGGWVTPAGWANRDHGAAWRFDGGRPGIAGYGNTQAIKIDSLTITNLYPTAGLLGWWKADSVAQADNTAVATWQDSHTTDKDMVQASGVSQPNLQTNEMNGLPVLRFDGVDDALKATMPITGPTVTTYMVLRVIAPIVGGRVASIGSAALSDLDNDASAGLGTFPSAVSLQTYRNGPKAYITLPATGTAFAYTALFDGTNNTVFLNGTAGTSAASTGNFAGDCLYAGSGATGGASTAPTNIDLAEFLIFNVAHDAATRKAIGRYLSQKWGTPPPP